MFNNNKDTITVRKKIDYNPKGSFPVVRPNLAVTPSKMLTMAENGIPISSLTQDKFFDGEFKLEWSIPAERKRGVDITDLWNLKKGVQSKVTAAHSKDMAEFGE